MATEMPILYEDSLSLDMTEGEMESVDSSYKGYAADDSDELDDIEMMVKNCQQRLDDDLDKPYKSTENSSHMKKEENGYVEEVHKAESPSSIESQEKGDDFYGIVIEGVKSLAEEEDFNLDESSKQSGTVSETGTAQESLDDDMLSNAMYMDIKNSTNIVDSNELEGTQFQCQASHESLTEKQDLNAKERELSPDENTDLLFSEANIKQEPMDDDDYIQEHDYFGNTDFNVYLNEGMNEGNVASEASQNMEEQTEDLDPSQLVQYQDQFSITDTGKYKCKFCCCSVSEFMTLKIHIDRLHQTNYSCKYCGVILPRSQDLASHTKRVHKNELMEKKQKLLSSMGKLLKKNQRKQKLVPKYDHDDVHDSGEKKSSANLGTYKCKHCPRRFEKSQSLAAHVQWWHKKAIVKNKFEVELPKESKRNIETKSKVYFNRTYRCRYCHRVFYKQQSMASHIKNCRKNTKRNKNSSKDKNIKKSNSFSSEESKLVTVPPKPSADMSSATKNSKVIDAKFIIHPVKKKKVKSKSKMKKASEIPMKKVVFRCPECSETFATKTLVQVHLNRMHATVWCRYCPKAFYKSSKFLLHIFRHIGDIDWLGNKKFFCKLCKIDLPYDKASVVHMKHHIAGKNPQGVTLNLEKQILLECEHCGRPFCSRTSLVFHELDHQMAINKRLRKKEEKSELIKKKLQEKCLKNGSDSAQKPKPSVGDLKLSEDLRALGIDVSQQNPILPNKAQHCVDNSEFIPASLIPFTCGMCEARFPNSQFLLHHMTLHMKGQYVFKIEVDKNAEETGKSSNDMSPVVSPDKCNISVSSDSLEGTRKIDIEEKEASAVSIQKTNNASDIPSEKAQSSILNTEGESKCNTESETKCNTESETRCQTLMDKEIARLTSLDIASATSKQDHSYAFLHQKAGMSNAVTQTQLEIPDQKIPTTTALTNNQNNIVTSISKGDKLVILQPKQKSSDFQVSLLKSKESLKQGTGVPVIILPSTSSSPIPFIQKISLPSKAVPPCNTQVSEVRQTQSTTTLTGSAAPVPVSFVKPTTAKDLVITATPQPSAAEMGAKKSGEETANSPDLNDASEFKTKSEESTETCESDIDIDSVLYSSSDSECFSDDSDCGICRTFVSERTQSTSVLKTKNDEDNSEQFSDSKVHPQATESGRSNIFSPVKQDLKTSQEYTSSFHGNFKKQLNFKDGKWFECEHCMYLCHTKQMFINHMQNHKAKRIKKMIKCAVCGRKVISKWHLSHHMKMHRRNEYLCSKCGSRFGTSSLVLKHMANCLS